MKGYTSNSIVAIILLGVLSSACGSDKKDSAGGLDLAIALESEFTVRGVNQLFLTAEGDTSGYSMMISGDGFDADVPIESEVPLASTVGLSYSEERNYLLGLTIFRDGFPYIEETLTWSYSEQKPYDPILSFDEKATNDDDVNLLIAARLKIETKEIWVKGDYQDGKEGQWFDLPESLELPLKITSGDGVKSFEAKTRNTYGTESEVVSLELIRKDDGPKDCSASLATKVVGGDVVRARFEAKDPYELLYEVTGDVRHGHKEIFEDRVDVSVYLKTESVDSRNLQLTIRDIAGNSCPPVNVTVRKASSYNGNEVKLVGEPLWTDVVDQILDITFESFENEVVEMRISGGISETEFTKKWVAFDPLSTEIPVALQTPGGKKTIFVDFRVDGDIVAPTYTTTVAFSPYIEYARETSKVFVSRFDETSISITGCLESYSDVAWQNGFPCTAAVGAVIEASFTFSDGSSTLRTVTVY